MAQVKRILLIEDHASFRQALAFMLEREPNLEVVGQAGSLAEARARARDLGTADGFDVAVVDLLLPDGDGADLIGELRKANPHFSAIVLTGNFDPESLQKAREAGAEEVLRKNLPLTELVEKIKRMGDRGTNVR